MSKNGERATTGASAVASSPVTISSEGKDSIVAKPHHECQLCNETFSSRNAMFRHIRMTHAPQNENQQPMKRHSVSVHFGYLGGCKEAGEIVRKAFESSFLHAIGKEGTTINALLEIMSTSQTSIANSRAQSLGQEEDCPAAEDIMFVNFRTRENDWNATIAKSTLLEMINIASGTRRDLTIHGMRELQSPGGDTQQQQQQHVLHAEHSCTQEVFHFLLPIDWLPGSQEILEWYKSDDHDDGKTSPPALRQFKQLLRSVESPTSKRVTAPRRFGALKHKRKRPFHCYADPKLQGDASPNTEAVWRIVDRARWIGPIKKDDAIFLVTEFCGDAFLKQQIRRIMGTVIAMSHGWLPSDFLETTINPEVLLETPLAPARYLYRAPSRFHANEIYHEGRRFFELDDVIRAPKSYTDPIDWIQNQLLHSSSHDRDADKRWLAELREEVCPRIRDQLKDLTTIQDTTIIDKKEIPEAYTRVLHLLRELIRTERWPSTSVARSSVIGNLAKGAKTESETASNEAGSFTVVSESDFETQHIELPMGNALFPELTIAVFDLERSLSTNNGDNGNMQRPPSSHCAVNCNAQFTPHVDSGRGSGQSLSMIVGLGDYSGGQLMLEGCPHDIRYKPLEFDGWKLRHWTRPFDGERFSLVFFTPEGMVPKDPKTTN